MFSSSSFAEWKLISENSERGIEFYIDTSSIKKNGQYVYFWKITNRLKPNQFGDLSNKNLYELDCSIPRKTKDLYIAYFTGPMGTGKQAGENTKEFLDTKGWNYIKPGSMLEPLAEYACNNAK